MLRTLRIRRGWRLIDLAARTRLSCTSLHRHEGGSISSLDRLEVHARALDVRIELRPVGRGTDLPRTLDEEHAAIVDALAAAFQADGGFHVEVEASYSESGERGRIDLLAGSADRLVVAEIKTDLGDLQELLGGLNAKARLGPVVARNLGWGDGPVAWLLAVATTSRNRSIVATHSALFRAYTQLRFNGSIPSQKHNRILLWVPPLRAGRRRWVAGRRRVRVG